MQGRAKAAMSDSGIRSLVPRNRSPRPVRAIAGVDAGGRKLKPRHGLAADKMTSNDFLAVRRLHKPVPDVGRVHHGDGAVLALIQAAYLLHANAAP